MTPERVVEAFFSAGAAGDLETLTRLFAEDAVWDNRIDGDPMGGLYEGRAAIRADLLEALFQFLPDGISTSVERTIVSGGTVVCLNRGTGLTRDGQRFEKRYLHIFDVADGLIRRVTEFRA